MESLDVNIKQEPLEKNLKANNNFKLVPCIKIEPEFGSKPKLYISSCETCETPIEPRLIGINIKKEPVVKLESNDVTEFEVKTCHFSEATSSIKSNFSPAPSTVKQNKSPIPNGKRTNLLNSFNFKKSDSPSLSSQKGTFYPYQQRFSNLMERSSPFPPQHFQHKTKRVHRPRHNYRNFHHKQSKYHRGSSYYRGRPRSWANNFAPYHMRNKENKFVEKTEEKPENQLRIVRMIAPNLEPKDCENALKEPNYPATSSVSDIHLNFHRDESLCRLNQTNSKSETTASPRCYNEVNNNVAEGLQEKQNFMECNIEGGNECNAYKDNDSEFNVDAHDQNIIDSTIKSRNRSEIEESYQIDSCIENQDQMSLQDCALNCMSNLNDGYYNIDSKEGSSSPESCLILGREGEESETFFILDEVTEGEYISEELMEDNMDTEEEIIKIFSNAESEIVKPLTDDEEEEDGTEMKKTDQEIGNTVNSIKAAENNKLKDDSESVLSCNSDLTTDNVEEVNSNMDVDDSEILEVLVVAQTEVEVVKEVSCDRDIECVFSRLKEKHLCTKCFVNKRRKRKKLDTDVILLKVKNKDTENIPIISIDEMEN